MSHDYMLDQLMFASWDHQDAELAAIDPALRAEVEVCAATLVGMPPAMAWARLHDTANTMIELLRVANPGADRKMIQNNVTLWARVTRRRSLELETENTSLN